MTPTQPQTEHAWLEKFVGEWTYEGEVYMGPGAAPERFSGCEHGRSLGGLWFLVEGHGEMPGFPEATTMLTLGYDALKRRYVGTWIGPMTTQLWVYDGYVDAAGRTLTLNAEGPDVSSPGKTTKYRDVTEFVSNDHRIFTSEMLGADGNWHRFVTAHYWRK